MSPLYLLAVVLAISQQQIYDVHGAVVIDASATSGAASALPAGAALNAANGLVGGITTSVTGGLGALTGGLSNTLTGTLANTPTGGHARPFNPIDGALDGVTNVLGGITQQVGSLTNSVIAGANPLLSVTGDLIGAATKPLAAITNTLTSPSLSASLALTGAIAPAATSGVTAATTAAAPVAAATENVIAAAGRPVAGVTNAVSGAVGPLFGRATGALSLNPLGSGLGAGSGAASANPIANPFIADAASLALPTVVQTLTRPITSTVGSLFGPTGGSFAGADPKLTNQLTNPLGLGVHKALSSVSGLYTGLAAGVGLNDVEKALSSSTNNVLNDLATPAPGGLAAGSSLINDAPVKALLARAPVGSSVSSGVTNALYGNYEGVTGSRVANQFSAIDTARLATPAMSPIAPALPYEATIAGREIIAQPEAFVGPQYGAYDSFSFVRPGAALERSIAMGSEFGAPTGAYRTHLVENIAEDIPFAAEAPIAPVTAQYGSPYGTAQVGAQYGNQYGAQYGTQYGAQYGAQYAADAAIDTSFAPAVGPVAPYAGYDAPAASSSPIAYATAAEPVTLNAPVRAVTPLASATPMASYTQDTFAASEVPVSQMVPFEHTTTASRLVQDTIAMPYSPVAPVPPVAPVAPVADVMVGTAAFRPSETAAIATEAALAPSRTLVRRAACDGTPPYGAEFVGPAAYQPDLLAAQQYNTYAAYPSASQAALGTGLTGFAPSYPADFAPSFALGFTQGAATMTAPIAAATSTPIATTTAITPVATAAVAPVATVTATPVAGPVGVPFSAANFPQTSAPSPIRSGMGTPATMAMNAALPPLEASPASRVGYNIEEAPVVTSTGEVRPEAWLHVTLVNYFDIPLRALPYGPYNRNPWISRIPTAQLATPIAV